MNITYFVIGYLYPFLYDVVHAAGGDDNAVGQVFNFFSSLITFDLTGLVINLLFPPMAIWFMLKYALNQILLYVQQASDFVNYQVIPWWNTIISDVLQVMNWIAYAAGLIWTTAVNVFNTLSLPYRTAWAFAEWLWTNGYGILVRLVWDTAGLIRDYAWPLIQSFFSPYLAYVWWLISLWSLARNFLIAFASNPAAVIENLVTPLLNALLSPFRPLLAFLAWWLTSGAAVLTRLVNNPSAFILGVIEAQFIAWLTQLIVENW